MKILGKMETDEILKGAAVIGGFSALCIAMVLLTNKYRGKDLDKAGGLLTKMSGAILIMAIAMKLIATMEWADIGKGLVCVLGLSAICAGMIYLTRKYSGRDLNKAGGLLLKMSGAILIMAIAMKLIATMEWADIGKGAAVVAGMMVLCAGIIAITKFAGKDAAKAGVTLLAMAGALLIMTGVIFILSQLVKTDPGAVWAAVGIIAILEVLFAGLIAVTKLAKNVTSTLIVLTIAIAVMAGAIAGLSFIDPTRLAAATGALAGLMVMFALLIFVTQYIKTGEKTWKRTLITLAALTLIVAALALCIMGLSHVEPERAIGSALSLSVLLLAMVGVIVILNKININAKKAMSGVLALTALAVPLLAFTAILLLANGIENAITNVIALSLLTAVMTLLLYPLSIVGSTWKEALLGVLALTALAVPLLAFTAILLLANGIENAITNVVALSTLMTVLTLLLIPLTIIGVFVEAALLGVLSLTAMAIPLLAFVGILYLMDGLQNGTENAKLLCDLLTVIGDVLCKLSLVAPLAVIAVAALSALTIVMGAIGVFAVAIGALMTKFPALEEFLDKGLAILNKLAFGIGEMIGNFVAGIATGIMQILPDLGKALGNFMINALPFIIGAKLVDKDVAAGVAILTGAILALTVAEVIEGIASFLTGGSSFADLGTQLSMFMLNATPFIIGAKMLDKTSMESVKILTDIILALTAADIIQGLTSWFTGGSSIADFANELAPLGEGLKSFSESTEGIDAERVKTAAEAAKNLAEMASYIPNEGGVVGWFAGENSISKFGNELGDLGSGLKAFSDNTEGIDAERIKAATEAAKTLAEMTSGIPNEGGVMGWLAGENSISKFGNDLGELGSGLKAFSDNTDGINIERVQVATEAAKSLAEIADTIPNEGGKVSWFTGDNSLSKFSDDIGELGTGIKNFSDNTDGINVERVQTASQAAKFLADIANNIPDSGGVKSWFAGDNSIASFGEELGKLGSGIKNFSDNTDGINIERVQAASKAANAIAGMAMPDDVDDIGDFGDELEDLGEGLSDFADEINSIDFNSINSRISSLKDIGSATSKINTDSAEGINKLKDAIKSLGEVDVSSIADKCVAALNNMKNKFWDAGKYVVQGFASGITANTYISEAASAAMARASYMAAKKALDINSPSKIFRKLAYSVPEGFANGIDRMSYLASDSAIAMTEEAIGGTKKAISKIIDVINSDVDTQPTIRPVLDLTDVRNGSSTIGTLLNTNPSLGLMSNIGSISMMMNNRQNGTNDDVISAIEDLGKAISSSSGDTYNVNGVTYDDGSAVSDAVKSIVRAARIERRR